MKRSPSNPVTLDIIAPDQATEIFVVDAGLRRIASGVGELKLDVEPGIYKVRFRSGSTQHDELVAVRPTDHHVSVSAPPVNFHSAAPLAETKTTHEYHAGPASQASRDVHLSAGRGSHLFVFAREEDPEEPEIDLNSVTVHELDGSPVASLAEGHVETAAKCAGINLELDPGTYRIRVETGAAGSYEVFATTAEQWQTQVFLVTETFAKHGDRVRRPSLRLATMLMARMGMGFDVWSPDARLAELARLGLANNRMVMSESDFQRMLYGKFEDPLLGVYGGYLMTLRHRPDWRLFDIVCDNVLALLGDHPDAQALALVRERHGGPRVSAITAPPSLRRSWETIIRAARQRPSLLAPEGSLAEIARNVLYTSTWLVHRVVPADETSVVAQEGRLPAKEVMRLLAAFDPQVFTEMVHEARDGGARFSELERNIVSTIMSAPQWQVAESSGVGDDEFEAERLMKRFDAPPAVVRTSLETLQAKLGV